MRLADFDYELAADLIAQHPIEPRDAARLLVDQGSAPPLHRHVRDIGEFLRDGDLLVVNDTKVIPARLRLTRVTGGAAEALLLEPLDAEMRTWDAMVRPARKLKAGDELLAGGRPLLRVLGRTEAGDTMRLELLGEGDPMVLLQQYGEMPLPPYITAHLDAPGRYQTVYANKPGSSAAPTAGLHFTPRLLESIGERGIEVARVELVVGLDTFKPVSAEDPRDHLIHSEQFKVSEEVLDQCVAAKRVVAVGTTSVRALESAATLGVGTGRTRLFIHRPYDWKLVDVLMTNFHMPRTTLLMMIDAFVGARWRALYEEALRENYRMLSFGDAMLLDRSLN
ncbi:tRNA preQ1(34) S-adenosylmethionine ribosyltransferase-isomerase QueA [soil metagenome]